VSPRGVGGVAVAAIRRRPSHTAEQVSQLLLGEPFQVVVGDVRKEWLRIRCEWDGYEGWVRSWHLMLQSEAEARRWRSAAGWNVAQLLAVVRREPRATAEPLVPLPWGSALLAAVGAAPPGWLRVGLPDGSRGYLRRREVAPRSGLRPAPTAASLERTARRFLGVPYEWGGRSSWGMDCSGLVQTVLAWHGVRLPRDAWMQARAMGLERSWKGPPSSTRWRAGNLAFFGPERGRISHVGILGTGRTLLHALGSVRADGLANSSEVMIKQLVTRYRGEISPGPKRNPENSR